ncbi:MAG TPA: hydrogenase expression/formation protein HypE [Acidobacteriota bacterium]|nr:hydrogenase expression/formation protein HypE [Acidobacteriota bacterium]
MSDKPDPVDLLSCPLPISDFKSVQLAHGAGGRLMNDLIRKLFVATFDSEELNRFEDAARIDVEGCRLAFSTDSYVVDPIFFPGGDIGELAVNGTVNDLCMSGARPLFLSVGFILEEGFPLEDLHRVVTSMRHAADCAGVTISAGDTKVVNRGKADKIFINTAGIGVLNRSFLVAPERIAPGDSVILSGSIADHGVAVLSRREGLSFEGAIESDTAPLNRLVETMLESGGEGIHAMRDPTRGGLAAALNEFAEAAGVGIEIWEESIPVNEPVAGACELLGLDPLHVANEGKLLAVVAPDVASQVVEEMRRNPLGRDAAVIGEVGPRRRGLVSMKTRVGGIRIVDMLVGEQLPRIC